MPHARMVFLATANPAEIGGRKQHAVEKRGPRGAYPEAKNPSPHLSVACPFVGARHASPLHWSAPDDYAKAFT